MRIWQAMGNERRAVRQPGWIRLVAGCSLFIAPWSLLSLLIAHCSRCFVATSECVTAWTERAIRFCTPTLRINFAT